MPTINDIAYIYNALPTASIILKANAPHFSIVMANSAFLKATHTDLSLIKNKDFFDKFPEINDENILDSMLMAFEQENGYVLRDTAGNTIRMIGVLQDITQRIEHELKIKEHLERYNAVSKATSDTIWDYNLLTNQIVWNNDGKDIFGHRQANDTYDLVESACSS